MRLRLIERLNRPGHVLGSKVFYVRGIEVRVIWELHTFFARWWRHRHEIHDVWHLRWKRCCDIRTDTVRWHLALGPVQLEHLYPWYLDENVITHTVGSTPQEASHG